MAGDVLVQDLSEFAGHRAVVPLGDFAQAGVLPSVHHDRLPVSHSPEASAAVGVKAHVANPVIHAPSAVVTSGHNRDVVSAEWEGRPGRPSVRLLLVAFSSSTEKLRGPPLRKGGGPLALSGCYR